MNPLYQLLNQANTLVVNRLLAHALGTNEAIIYACLISKYYYYADRNMLNDGWFYSTAPDLQESSTLSEKQQKRAVDNLVKAGLLKCELRGMPAKRSFFIIENAELIGYYIAKGEEIATKIKPKAAETYERKRQTGEDTPNDTAVLPCSDKTAEQETTKGQTLLRQKVGACSDETAEHTFNHNINNHHIRNPYQSISPAAENMPDGIDKIGYSAQAEVSSSTDERAAYRNVICHNIDYEALIEDNQFRQQQIDELVDIMLDTICSTKQFIRVNGEEYPKEVVKSQLLKLNSEHIEYVLTAMKKSSSDIKNIRAYLITALYNAPMTMDNYYSAWVNHDMR